MIVGVFWIVSAPILNDFQCLLVSLLVLNSSTCPKRQTAETMQNTCRDLARNSRKRELARNLQRTCRTSARISQDMRKSLQKTSKKPAKQISKSHGILHASTRQQPPQTQSYIIRGGGARAARRTRILQGYEKKLAQI